MSIVCETCRHHRCCHNVKSSFAIPEDLTRFQNAGNVLHKHASLADLNRHKRPGINYFVRPDESIALEMLGWCAAFDHATGNCLVHNPDTEPFICQITPVGSDICT